MEKQTIERADKENIYEISYLLLPSLAEGQVPLDASSIKEAITSKGGAVVSFEDPVLIDLAYPMTKVSQVSRQKVTRAYFGWLKFEIAKEGIGEVKKLMDSNEKVLRHLIIKTVRENTLLTGKMKLGQGERVKASPLNLGVDEAVEGPKASTEEIDKSIDELVVTE